MTRVRVKVGQIFLQVRQIRDFFTADLIHFGAQKSALKKSFILSQIGGNLTQFEPKSALKNPRICPISGAYLTHFEPESDILEGYRLVLVGGK